MIPAMTAVRRSKANRASRWTGTEDCAADRLAGRIVVPDSSPSFQARPGHTVFAIGSCFARNVEEALEDAGVDVLSRRYALPEMGATTPRTAGIFNKYTPISILQELQLAAGERTLDQRSFLELVDGVFYDPQLRIISGTGSVAALLARRRQVTAYFRQAFEADIVIMTLGLIEAWYDRISGLYLVEAPAPQCIKREPDRFGFEIFDAQRCLDAVKEVRDLLHRHRGKETRLIVTVSPVPLARTFSALDVLSANTLSKSTLVVAANRFAEEVEGVDYFPSYEAATVSDPAVVWDADRRHVTDFMVTRIIRTFLVRYGFRQNTETVGSPPNAATSPDAQLIRKLLDQVETYKKAIIRLQSALDQSRAASGQGVPPDSGPD